MVDAGKDAILKKVWEIAERSADREGIEVVDVSLAGSGKARLLRIFIDKPEGVTHGDCELLSQQVGTVLDVEDVIPGGRYTLEVSSPGVERELKRAKDFARFAGQKAKVVLKQPVADRKHWEGILRGIAGDVITMEDAPGHEVQFPLEQVQRANLKFEW